jgi:nitrate/TMAO reductase-like tetraheme cytochrome c subunit
MTRRALFVIFLLLVAVLGIAATAGWGVLTYTSSPSFCSSCHIMQTRYVSWQRSAHWGKATCIECHSEPGTWGEIKAHLNGTRYLYVMMTGAMSGPILRASVESATCESCHAPAQLPESARNHRIHHQFHRSAAIECVACHGGLVHGTLRGGQARPAMETCVGCHIKESPVLANCGSCHVNSLRSSVAQRLR